MSDNQYREIGPYEVAVSDMNERRSSPATSTIQESIEQQGVIQPPLVREREDVPDSAEVPYEAVVGQRRVLGAQAAGGVETIPVVVVSWNDAEALEASITENIDAFSENVSPKDRAEAVVRLMEMCGYNQQQAADSLGVDFRTLHTWIEHGREEWEETAIHIDGDSENASSPSAERTRQAVDETPTQSVGLIRRATGGGESGEEAIRKVHEGGLSESEVREAKRRTANSEEEKTFVDSVEEVAVEKEMDTSARTEGVSVRLGFSGDEAEALTTAAKQRGATENQVARQEIVQYLNREGFL